MVLYIDNEPDTYISIEHVYKDNQQIGQDNNNLLLFDFHVVYNRTPPDSNLEEYININNWQVREEEKTHELDKDFLMGGNRAHIEDIVRQILDNIEVPAYRDIVDRLTLEILDLQKREMMRVSPEVERIKVDLDVLVQRFPGEPAVAAASEEALMTHLETVVVENDEGYCVICMDTIQTGSDVVEAARMPCSHVFHRPCAEKWLRSSAICPVCREVFPS